MLTTILLAISACWGNTGLLSTFRAWGIPPQQNSNLCKENACIHGRWGLGHLEHLWLKLTLKRQDFYVGPLEQRWVRVLAMTAAVVPVSGVSSCPQGIFSESSCGALKAATASGRQLLRSPKKRLHLIDSSCGLCGRSRIEVWLPPSPMALNW